MTDERTRIHQAFFGLWGLALSVLIVQGFVKKFFSQHDFVLAAILSIIAAVVVTVFCFTTAYQGYRVVRA